MSAFMVSDAHVDFLATAYLRLVEADADPQQIGEIMIRDNARSIRARYGHNRQMCRGADEQAARYTFQRWTGPLDPLNISKQIACLDYQSCEFDGWFQSASRALLNKLQAHVPIFDDCLATERDAHPWGIDDHPAPVASLADCAREHQAPPPVDAAVVVPLRLASTLGPVGASQAPVDGLPLFDEDRSPRLL